MYLVQRAEEAGILSRAVDFIIESMKAPTQQMRQGERELWRESKKC